MAEPQGVTAPQVAAAFCGFCEGRGYCLTVFGSRRACPSCKPTREPSAPVSVVPARTCCGGAVARNVPCPCCGKQLLEG